MLNMILGPYLLMSFFVFGETIYRGIKKYQTNNHYSTKEDFFKIMFDFDPNEIFSFNKDEDGYFFSALFLALISPLSFPFMIVYQITGLLFTFIKK